MVARALFADDRQKLLSRKIKTRVRWNRLDDYCSNFIFVFLKRFLQQLGIVERQRDCQISKCRRNTSTARLTVRERAAPGFDQKGVCVPMITAVKLDDLIAPAKRAREANT